MTETQMAVLEWLANSDNTGLSSKTMAFWLAFGIKKEDAHYPHDPADFNRCVWLFHAAPKLRSELHMMAALGPQWANLVVHWYRIERQLEAEVGPDWSKNQRTPATKTYALMKAVLDNKPLPTEETEPA